MAVADLFTLNLIHGRILAAYVRMCEACRAFNFDEAAAALHAMDERLDLLARRLRAHAG